MGPIGHSRLPAKSIFYVRSVPLSGPARELLRLALWLARDFAAGVRQQDGSTSAEWSGISLFAFPAMNRWAFLLASRVAGPHSREGAVAALDALRAELEAKGVPVKEGSWGYRLLVVDDPDGNQLFFNYPSETASGKIARDEA